MKSLLDHLGLSSLAELWLLQVFLMVLGTVLANIASHILIRHAEKTSRLTTGLWDDVVVYAAKRPVPIAIWLIGIAFAADIADRKSAATVFEVVPYVRDIGVVVCLAWFVIRVISKFTNNVVANYERKGQEVDHTTLAALSKLARFTVIITASLIVMQTLGFSVAGILAAGGIGGLALGFAAKDLLANFIGGLTIYMDRPFGVGDWIRSPDKNIEGIVEHISWRHTRIRAFNKNPIYVPNALFTTIVLENPSRMSHRRISETIGIRYQDIGTMGAIVADVKSMLQNHPEIDTKQPVIASFNTFGASSLDFFIFALTRTKEWVRYHEIKQGVLLKVAEIIDRHGAHIAFPTRALQIEPGAASRVAAPESDVAGAASMGTGGAGNDRRKGVGVARK